MDLINPEFKTTDAVIVIGANDVVNPAATTQTDSPIYGMPILEAHHARTVFVIKRFGALVMRALRMGCLKWTTR